MPSLIPEDLKQHIRPVWRLFRTKLGGLRANITQPIGKLPIDKGPCTFVLVVGPAFDQNRPDAMMTCRLGYCHAFEELGIPYVIVDLHDLAEMLPKFVKPFCMVFGGDYAFMNLSNRRALQDCPKFVWVSPWFNGSDSFFKLHGLDPTIWTWSEGLRKRILDSQPSFVFTATVESGLEFFEKWAEAGMPLISLPLACDTSVYQKAPPYYEEFEGVHMAFVGGYWKSKGAQMDKYLRPFEEQLVIYGYNKWPYRGYRGQLTREKEGSLYYQAKLSPTINEPTVKLLHGQINERVFKILGSGGLTVVDSVPSYRMLFHEEELPVPKDECEFFDIVHDILESEPLQLQYKKKGYEAVMSRHTYIHRSIQILQNLGLPYSFGEGDNQDILVEKK